MEKPQNLTERDVGRPTVFTDEVLRKLEEVWAIGGTDREAIFYADISSSALYEYLEKHPELKERKEKLKERPILKARQTIVKALDNPEDAKWYLERKAKKEFAQRTENLNENVNINITPIYNGVSRYDSNTQDILPEKKD